MRKFIFILCVILLLTGCQKAEEQSESYYYFLFATPLREHPIWLQAKEGFFDACDEYGVRCDWIGSTTIDTNKMEEVVETGILQGADGIITQGVIQDQYIEEAKAKGIPMILVDSDMANTSRLAFMGKDFHEQAKILLEDIEAKYGKEKHLNIAIQVAEYSFAIAKDQISQIEEVFQTHPGGYKIRSISESKSDKVRAKQEWEQTLKENKDVNVSINFAAESAQFCYEAAKEQGIRETMLIYGVDDMPDTLALIRNHAIDGSVVINSFYDYGYESVKLLYDYKTKGIEPEDRIISPNLIIVNNDNIDFYKEENSHDSASED